MELLTTGEYHFDDTPVRLNRTARCIRPRAFGATRDQSPGASATTTPNGIRRPTPRPGQPVMPWAGTTFKLERGHRSRIIWCTLMSDPTSAENAIKFPTVAEAYVALGKFAEGLLIDLWPVFPGSPLCDGMCGPLSDLGEPWYHEHPLSKSPISGPRHDDHDPIACSEFGTRWPGGLRHLWCGRRLHAAKQRRCSYRAGLSHGKGPGGQNVGHHSTVAQTTNAVTTDTTGTSTDTLAGRRRLR